jgi:multiple sugar transport system permease protein
VATAAETAERGRVAPAAPKGLRHGARRVRRNWDAYVFLAPGFIIFTVFTLFALVFVVYLTFHEWSIIEPEKPFVGLQNYKDLIEDERFRRSVINTFYFTGASVPLAMICGLAIALLLNQPLRGRWVFRTAYYLPAITPFVVSAIVWKWLYNGDYGLFNYYLLKTNLIHEPLAWLSDQQLAMPAVILMTVWTGVGFSMVVYLAGLQSIPEELYEAAKVDGAGAWARFRHITLPGLLPSTVFLLVIQIIFNMQIFTQIFVMTRGGPIDRTTTVLFYVYEAAFQFYEMGYASTIAFALFLMLLVFTGLQLRMYRKAAA